MSKTEREVIKEVFERNKEKYYKLSTLGLYRLEDMSDLQKNSERQALRTYYDGVFDAFSITYVEELKRLDGVKPCEIIEEEKQGLRKNIDDYDVGDSTIDAIMEFLELAINSFREQEESALKENRECYDNRRFKEAVLCEKDYWEARHKVEGIKSLLYFIREKRDKQNGKI